ncbi:unnamed protein product, partial [Arabidopsis halleri]
ISVIASGIGEPLHTEKSRLDPINIGSTKVKVVIKLDSALPSSVIVKDVHGNSSRVAVEYPRPPPHCLNCGKYGHLLSRCPKPLMKKTPFKKVLPTGSSVVNHPSVTLPQDSGIAGTSSAKLQTVHPMATSKPRRRRSRSRKRSRSTPPSALVHLPLENSAPSSDFFDKGKGLKTVSTSRVPLILPLTRKSPAPANVEVSKQKQDDKSVVVKAKGKEIDPNFPIPPGWRVMSKKTRKKLLKKWHNHMSSKVPGVYVPVRVASSSGTSNL